MILKSIVTMKSDIKALLGDIEQELRALALWEIKPPPIAALSSSIPFCMDTLTFSQWLQWIFLPRLLSILSQESPLPTGANILPYAEEACLGEGIKSAKILKLIKQLDELLG